MTALRRRDIAGYKVTFEEVPVTHLSHFQPHPEAGDGRTVERADRGLGAGPARDGPVE